MKNIIVGQSGGPTAVINSSLYGVISEAFAQDVIGHVYGMENGIEGFLKGHYMDMATISEKDLAALPTTPGAYLGSCRYKLPEQLDDDVYPQLFQRFQELDIGYFFYIGGNDSMDTVSKLSRYAQQIGSDIKIAGIPKTIDNDLVLTDHTPGFGSAAKFVASMVREIGRDAAVYDTRSVTIVEIMGRHAGWLTASSALARQFEGDNPVLIYLPERDFDENDFIASIENAFTKTKNLIVCVSEGIHDSQGAFVCEHTGAMQIDNFGHKILTGCGKYLEHVVRRKLGVKVRSVELNVTQRCASSYLSATDIAEAEDAGRFGVKAALAGQTGFMSAFVRTDSDNYTMELMAVNVNDVCNLEKMIPQQWINEAGNDVTDDFIRYALPLIQGDVKLPKENGLSYFAYRPK